MNGVDLVYVLGNGSQANDWELRMSLRSVWAHFPARRYVWLVGHCPAWIAKGSVRHLPCLDPWTGCKDANLIGKLLMAALHPEVSDRFIFMSDDQLFLRETRPEDFRAWHLGPLTEEAPRGTKWEKRLWHTGAALRASGLPSYHWDAHIPYLMTKEGVRRLAEWPWAKSPGYTIGTLYHGANQSEPVAIDSEHVRGDLRNPKLSERVISWKLEVNRFATLGPDSLQNYFLLRSIERRFPTPCPCEGDLCRPSAASPRPSGKRVAETPRPFSAGPSCPVFGPSRLPLKPLA